MVDLVALGQPRKPTGGRSRRGPALGLVLALVLTACGTRMSHNQVVAAARSRAGGASGGAAGAGDQGAAEGGATGGGASASGSGAAAGAAGGGGAGTAGRAGGTRAGTAGAVAGAGVAARGAPIVIGSVGNYSGPTGASEADGPKGLQLWARYVNDHGGVAGHPVKVIVVDDGSDPARYQSALRDLVENRGAIAFVAQFAPFTFASGIKYLEDKKVPVIGGDCAGYIWNQSPMVFPQCPGFENSLYGILNNATRFGGGKKKFGAMICQEATACKDLETVWFDKGIAKAAGLDPVYRGHVSLGEPDFTAECLQAQSAGVEVLSIVLDVNGVGRALDSCARQNFYPLIVLGSGTMDANLAKKPGMNSPPALIQLNDFPWDNSGAPAVAEYNAALRQYAPGTESTPTLTQGWAAAEIFGKAAAMMGDVASKDKLLDALWSFKNETFGGLTPPLTFVKDQPAPNANCWFYVTVKNGKMTAPQGNTPLCR